MCSSERKQLLTTLGTFVDQTLEITSIPPSWTRSPLWDGYWRYLSWPDPLFRIRARVHARCVTRVVLSACSRHEAALFSRARYKRVIDDSDLRSTAATRIVHHRRARARSRQMTLVDDATRMHISVASAENANCTYRLSNAHARFTHLPSRSRLPGVKNTIPPQFRKSVVKCKGGSPRREIETTIP